MPGFTYLSTRGKAPRVESAEAIVRGIAPDGGLYVPSSIPDIGGQLDQLIGMDYRSLAGYIMALYMPDFGEMDIRNAVSRAYGEKFDHPLVAPLARKGGAYFLELFHGPTLAFKDLALTVLPHLLKAAAAKLGIKKEIVILTATSGDTGKAALEGFADVEGTRIIVFYPEDGVSRIQERQMTTQKGENTYVIAIEGNFDDAQRGVKDLFNDSQFNKRMEESGFAFSSANSINAGRLIPQIVYYVHSYLEILKNGGIGPDGKINIVVPTGNFGNILAAYYSKKMGIPVNMLICASNENNVLYDFINTGIYDRRRNLVATSSPSMDILVSSNLERLLFDLSGKDPRLVRKLTGDLATKGIFEIDENMRKGLSCFQGGFATDSETFRTIKLVFENYGYLIDTHTAVGYNVYLKYLEETNDRRPAVIASTASPFKFPGSVAGALDSRYCGMDEFKLIDVLSGMSGIKVPESIAGISSREILHRKSCRVEQMKDVVASILDISG
ncbi:MAG: threonine synthase [Actinobacteria bacterium]|nr:threonine synthase [Actinomycetota bacterium]